MKSILRSIFSNDLNVFDLMSIFLLVNVIKGIDARDLGSYLTIAVIWVVWIVVSVIISNAANRRWAGDSKDENT